MLIFYFFLNYKALPCVIYKIACEQLIMETHKLKTRKEIALELGISNRTLKRWTEKHEIEVPSGLISPKLQKLMKSKFLSEDN